MQFALLPAGILTILLVLSRQADAATAAPTAASPAPSATTCPTSSSLLPAAVTCATPPPPPPTPPTPAPPRHYLPHVFIAAPRGRNLRHLNCHVDSDVGDHRG